MSSPSWGLSRAGVLLNGLESKPVPQQRPAVRLRPGDVVTVVVNTADAAAAFDVNGVDVGDVCMPRELFADTGAGVVPAVSVSSRRGTAQLSVCR